MDKDKQTQDPFKVNVVPDAPATELNDDQLDDASGGLRPSACGGSSCSVGSTKPGK